MQKLLTDKNPINASIYELFYMAVSGKFCWVVYWVSCLCFCQPPGTGSPLPAAGDRLSPASRRGPALLYGRG